MDYRLSLKVHWLWREQTQTLLNREMKIEADDENDRKGAVIEKREYSESVWSLKAI